MGWVGAGWEERAGVALGAYRECLTRAQTEICRHLTSLHVTIHSRA